MTRNLAIAEPIGRDRAALRVESDGPAAVGIGIGLGSLLGQLLLFNVLRSLGGVWDTIAHHFPIIYSEALTPDVAAAGFIPGTGLVRMTAGDPTVVHSIIALGIWMVALLAAALVAVRMRDVID